MIIFSIIIMMVRNPLLEILIISFKGYTYDIIEIGRNFNSGGYLWIMM